MKDAKVNDSIGTSQDSNGAVEKAIHTTPGSISYLAMSYMIGDKQDALKTIKIDGAEPTIDNISNKSYPFWSYEYMVTHIYRHLDSSLSMTAYSTRRYHSK